MGGNHSSASKFVVRLRDATFLLDRARIFAGTTWQFSRGQQWAIIGPNGSGKSLFLEALRGRLPLVSGELQCGFRPPRGLSAEEAIGHVGFEDRFQDIGDLVLQSRWNSIEEDSSLRVCDFLSYERVLEINPFEVRSDDEPERLAFARRQQRAIRLAGLSGLLNRAVVSLSNGERQKLQIAHALSGPLRLLLLDEPFAGLDSASRASFSRVLDCLMRAGLPVILATTRREDLPPAVTHCLEIRGLRVYKSEPLARSTDAIRPATLRRLKPPPARGKVLVELRNVRVEYGSVQVLDRLSWTIREGERWALLGPNGSGKSTLLGLIAGDHPQAYGNEVRVFGMRRGEGESVWDIKRRLGTVSPELQLHFDQDLSCREVVASGFFDSVGLYERPTRTQWQRVASCLEQMQLLPWADESFGALSPGFQRIALIARALVKRPRLLFLDEPCQGLDAEHRRAVLRQVSRVAAHPGIALVYVSHRADELPSCINRVLDLRAQTYS